MARYDGHPEKLARWRPNASAPPSVAVWEITLRCDLGCGHCGSRAGKARPNELSTDEALDVVDQLADLGLREVTLIGGEFYLREDWDRIARAITDRGMFCSLVTGGRQMNEDRVARAADAGVQKISLSLDGLEATHDAIRGVRGSWRAAFDAGERIVRAGIDLSVNTQMNRLTLPELPRFADLLVDLGARSWMVILTVPLGRGADRLLHLEPYHLLYLFPLLAEIKKEQLDPRGIAFFPSNNVGYFGPLAETLRYGAEHGYRWNGCGAGISSLGLEADGRVKGCPSLPTKPYERGNVRETPLRELAARLSAERRDEPIPLWGHCATCPHAKRCRAGCTWTSHAIFGRAGNNPYCHSRALAQARRGVAEKLVPVAAAPGEPFDFGRFAIEEVPLEETLAADPLLGIARMAKLFGLRADAASAWNPDDLRAGLAKHGVAER